MSLTMVLADDHTVVLDGLRPWLETQADLHGIEAAPRSGMRGPGSQTLLSPKSKMLPAIVEILLPNGQEFLTDRRDISLKLITEDQELG
jgi:hypothetical protein